jgi:aminoglycoside 3-N-acetyltransferase
MSEGAVIARTRAPGTITSLASDLRLLGVEPGMTLLVHSSLSALGWVCGGSVAVVRALMDVLTAAGTLVMPAHSANLSDPAQWQNPAVPPEWVPVIRATMPAFEPRLTPTYCMGQIVETFRTWPGVVRSAHPHHSFVAWGRHAERITSAHALDYSLGEGSPLARLYDVDGSVLLLGVGYESNTSFHLAEYRVPDARETEQGAPILDGDQRVWATFRDIVLDEKPFVTIGKELERERLGGTPGADWARRGALLFRQLALGTLRGRVVHRCMDRVSQALSSWYPAEECHVPADRSARESGTGPTSVAPLTRRYGGVAARAPGGRFVPACSPLSVSVPHAARPARRTDHTCRAG